MATCAGRLTPCLSPHPGVLGKRTYFQESRPQLALRVTDAGPLSPAPREDGEEPREDGVEPREDGVEPREDGEEEWPAKDASEPPLCGRLPADLRLGDDTRLERVRYDDPGLETDTSPLAQAVIITKL